MPRPLSELPIDQLKTLAANFRRLNQTVGPHFTLADVLREIDLKEGTTFTIDGLANLAIQRALDDPAKKVSYREMYLAVHGGPPPQGFVGNGWRIPLTNKLLELSEYCYAKGWPLISILVVNDSTRRLSEDAQAAFWDEWRERYPEIKAINAEKWCEQMTELALEFIRNNPGSFGLLAA